MLHDIKGRNIVLFLDDLERISDGLDVTSLLGQVYTTFIENNIKVVLIANEKEIAKASVGRSGNDTVSDGDGTSWEREQYQWAKEKYIRYTYKFICPDLRQIIGIFASSYIKQDEDKNAYDALTSAFLNEFCGAKDGDNTDKADSTEIGMPVNLRTVQWCCQSCGKIYNITKIPRGLKKRTIAADNSSFVPLLR